MKPPPVQISMVIASYIRQQWGLKILEEGIAALVSRLRHHGLARTSSWYGRNADANACSDAPFPSPQLLRRSSCRSSIAHLDG